MTHKKITSTLLALTFFLVACVAVTSVLPATQTIEPVPTTAPANPTTTPANPTAAPANPTTPPASTTPPWHSNLTDMTAVLKKLGGKPCQEKPDFTCVTIKVPLDHFDSANTQTLNVVFAILPATGKRTGMYVQAFPGGPGGVGIASAGVTRFDPSILEHFDIVFFDQRGLGLSSPFACPKAYAKDFLTYLGSVDKDGVEGYDTPAEQTAIVDEARSFIQQCVTETGIDPSKLKYYGTKQVAEDIESFRQAIGEEKFWLYGVSYGTAVAQTYAAAHSDRLAGLILDGTIDMTLSAQDSAFSQEKAFNDVLVASLKECDAEKACVADLGGDALSVYDTLAAQISKQPIAYDFPLPSGQTVSRIFTFNELEYTAAYQMYSLSGRMQFLRALAAAKSGDIIPMARLLYLNANLDSKTGAYKGDPAFSDTLFYAVMCTDSPFYSGTIDERIAKIIAAGQASNGTVPRLDGSIYTGLDCVFWPSAPTTAEQTKPLVAEGVPTLVLNATLDPATPFHEGKTVYEHLADGYHIYVEGGRHSIYGFGQDCPDKLVTDFLVDGKVPGERETVCKWDPAIIRAYQPILPEDSTSFVDPLETLSAIDSNIQLFPEYFYGDLAKDESVACTYGGTFTFGPSDAGETYTFKNCAFLKDFVLTGSGSNDYKGTLIKFDVQVSGAKTGKLTYTHNTKDDSATLSGEYGGQKIDLSK